jgi:hypothetical protein
MEGSMSRISLSLILAVSGLALGAAAGAFAAQSSRVDGFGPHIANDQTLNKNIGVLSEQIAWLNSPESDAYQLAQATSGNADFVEVAHMSTGSAAQGHFPSVSDDSSLNRSNGIISRLIAWQNSSQGDAFMVAQAEPSTTGSEFQRVALASLR